MAIGKGEPRLSVPMWIDAVKSDGGFEMTRLSYFSAEADEPIGDQALYPTQSEMPVLVHGLTCAICHPDMRRGNFESAGDIEEMFERVEGSGEFSIETPDLWLPNELLFSKHTPKRGDVYRVDKGLFAAALRFRSGRTTEKEFREECAKVRRKPAYSAHETRVIAEWSEMQVQVARETYQEEKDSGNYMGYRE